MSKKHPECPLYDHRNCKLCYHPEICALVRSDHQCLKPVKGNPRNKEKEKADE